MQDEGKVKKKLKDAKFRYMKRELRGKLKQCPENCQHNFRHKFTAYEYAEGDSKPVPYEGELGLCMYGASNPEAWPGKICDDVKTAEECPLFLGKFDKEEIKSAFNARLDDPVIVAEEYKDIAALQWVLGENVAELDPSWHQRAWVAIMFYLYTTSEFVRKSGFF